MVSFSSAYSEHFAFLHGKEELKIGRGGERKEVAHEVQISLFCHKGIFESTAPRKRFFSKCECYRGAGALSSEGVVGGCFVCTRFCPVASIDFVIFCGHTP